MTESLDVARVSGMWVIVLRCEYDWRHGFIFIDLFIFLPFHYLLLFLLLYNNEQNIVKEFKKKDDVE